MLHQGVTVELNSTAGKIYIRTEYGIPGIGNSFARGEIYRFLRIQKKE